MDSEKSSSDAKTKIGKPKGRGPKSNHNKKARIIVRNLSFKVPSVTKTSNRIYSTTKSFSSHVPIGHRRSCQKLVSTLWRSWRCQIVEKTWWHPCRLCICSVQNSSLCCTRHQRMQRKTIFRYNFAFNHI